MEDTPDTMLVNECLGGNREAFATLVRRYQDYAYGTAIGILSDFDLARDVVQEAFLCAYRDLPKLKDPARFAGWLHGIVRHTAYRALRELERVRSLAEELSGTVEPFAQTPPPDQAAEEAERRETVRRALERLGNKNREAVSLYYVDGLSYAEIAGFLGVTETAVQGRLQRGRAELRKELTMVAKTFKEEQLPEDFSAEIQQLLEATAECSEERTRAIERLAEIGQQAVEPLCDALGDPRWAVRAAAARALSRIGDPRALRPILRLLYADDAWRYWRVFGRGQVLGIPGVRDALLEILSRGEECNQSSAIEALSHIEGDKEVYDCISEVFHNADAYSVGARVDAFQALCRLAPESGVEFATKAMQDPGLRRRGSVWWIALSHEFLPPIEDCLRGFGKRYPSNVRTLAGLLVLKHGDEGNQALQRVMRTGSEAQRATAALALACTGHREAFDVLKQELLAERRDTKWISSVSRVLAWHWGRQLAQWIETDLPRLARAGAAAWTLARSRQPETEATAEELFREGTPSVRAAAIRMLVRERGAAFLPELRRCLRRTRPSKVAQEAFWQMFRLGEAAVPTALEMLESEHWGERKAAVCLLRRWGKLTPEQKVRAVQDPHIAVRQAAK